MDNQTPSNLSSSGVTGSVDHKQIPSGTTVSKEHEAPQILAGEGLQEITQEVEVSDEVERAGVSPVKESYDVPPDVKKLGVTQAGASLPAASANVPAVVLPISDSQIVAGLHTKLILSLRWLAVWCMRRLKKAHLMLKYVHGKIIRVRT